MRESKVKTPPCEKHILDRVAVIWCTNRVSRIIVFFIIMVSAGVVRVCGEPAETPVVQAQQAVASEPAARLSTRDAVILGLVEGITEFLPISSTGHLIIATNALGLESDAPLVDANGDVLWHKKPSDRNPAGEPLTMKLAADTYVVVIQIGAILAVVFLYWGQILSMAGGLAGRNAAGLRLLRNVIIAVFPSAVIGLVMHHYRIDEKLFSIEAVVAALVSGAVLMWAAEKWRKNQWPTTKNRRDLDTLTAKQALGIGLMQCLALWPGTSRSMVTMVGGYFCGLSPAKAAEFSFLVGLPTLAGASLLKGVSSGGAMVAVFGWPHVLLGIAVAMVSAIFAVRFLVSFLSRHGLGVFAIYRVLLAFVLVMWFLV